MTSQYGVTHLSQVIEFFRRHAVEPVLVISNLLDSGEAERAVGEELVARRDFGGSYLKDARVLRFDEEVRLLLETGRKAKPLGRILATEGLPTILQLLIEIVQLAPCVSRSDLCTHRVQ